MAKMVFGTVALFGLGRLDVSTGGLGGRSVLRRVLACQYVTALVNVHLSDIYLLGGVHVSVASLLVWLFDRAWSFVLGTDAVRPLSGVIPWFHVG